MFRAQLKCGNESAPLCEEIFFALGADSVSVSHTKDDESLLSALFTSKPETRALKKNFKGMDISVEEVSSDGWNDLWLKDYNGAALTSRAFVIPAQKSGSANGAYEYVIRLDPRGAFGDGSHPTTSMCALLIEMFMSRKKKLPRAIIDIGTGTGILAIYCSLLGAKDITAIDISPESITRAESNAALNKVTNIKFIHSGIEDFPASGKYDLIIANLQSALIEENIHSIARIGGPGAHYIFSGIGTIWLEDTRRTVSSAIKIEQTLTQGDWAAFGGIKNEQ